MGQDSSMTRSLEGAVVAVLGATGGLGAPISAELTRRGAVVVLAGRSADRLATVPGVPPDALQVVLDITDPAAGDVLIDAVQQRHARLDGVVIASGVVAFGNLADTPDEVIEEVFLTNVVGPLWFLRRCLPLLAEYKGFVANLSAVVAETPLAGMTAYAASKAALTAADTALAREVRRAGVTVCDVRPPHTETGLAGRPLAGTAPRLAEGLSPGEVARRIVDAIEADAREVPSSAFSD
jgi:NAD(P)-dependent dehydrogenase (short-subunit alcohol dehydrogenase family)